MAYPTVNGPYGLLPINLIGGQVFAGSTRQIPIASGYGTSIFYGDVVKLNTDGTLVKDTGTATATPIGVFLGCTFTDPVYGKTFRQYYPSGTVASDIAAYVVDDPDTLFKVVNVSGTTVVSAAGRTVVGLNAALVQNAGNTNTGDSAVGITGFDTTVTLPIRVIDVVPQTVLTTTQSASTTNTSTSVTLSAANSGILKYMGVSGTGIAAGTYVAAISGTSLTLSAAATATGTATLTFVGYPELIVKWNAPSATGIAGGHQYLNPTGV
ncbi:MAG: hypothetical protein EBR82_49835 [Caulobacteraceae bacterium]|nr:hypothetical protein [Caulobacteraceae bacterium]